MRLARLVLATANAGKVRELRALIAEWGTVEVLTLGDLPEVRLPPETGTTYLANAVPKATTVRDASGIAALADDSGIEVDALGGAPGVHSARYGDGEAACNAKLLEALAGVPPERRTARYRAVVALALPDGVVWTAEGTCEGRIAEAPRGDAGFGYDPIFVLPALGRTVGEATAEEKARVSHRARAMRALGRRLQGRGIV
jgi:XTP/dITP diphosphohydrolase